MKWATVLFDAAWLVMFCLAVIYLAAYADELAGSFWRLMEALG